MSETLEQMIKQSVEAVAAMTPEERSAMYAAQRASWVRAEIGFGIDADEAAYRAAYDSGDLDEIARLRREADERIANADMGRPG